MNLVERPWAIDNLDDILERWKEKPHHKAMLFVDNAGTDVVLGKFLHLISFTSHLISFTSNLIYV